MSPVWRRLAPGDLEREYTPSSNVASREAALQAYVDAGVAARAALPPVTHAYGEHADEVLDYLPAGRAGAPLHVFVHGGYWQALSKDDGWFLAPAFHRAGAAFASVNYSLAPAARLDEIVDQVRRAVAWLHHHAPRLGHDPMRVVASGHSAGAQLVAEVLAHDWGHDGFAHHPLAGAVLVSGVYDLEPLCLTSVNDAVGLDASAARRLSPLHRIPHLSASLIVTWGEHDTDEFRRQGLAYASAWAEAGNRPPTVLEVAGRNHFDVLFDLAEPDRPLGRVVLAQLGRPRP